MVDKIVNNNQLNLPPVVQSPHRTNQDGGTARTIKLNQLQIGHNLLSPRQDHGLAPIRGSNMSRNRRISPPQHLLNRSNHDVMMMGGSISSPISIPDTATGISQKKASFVAAAQQIKSQSPSPHRSIRRDGTNWGGGDELNSDIMVLISKPKGVSKVDPLRL